MLFLNRLNIQRLKKTVQHSLFEEMAVAGVKSVVFSSSATVYGDPASVPITEDFPLSATNPYGRSKLFIEDMLRDMARADADWNVAGSR